MLHSYFEPSQGSALLFVILVAAAVFVFSIGLAALVTAIAGPLRRRLGQVGDRTSEATSGGASLAERLRPLAGYLMPKKEAERSRVSRRPMYAGYRSSSALLLFYASKALLMIGLPFAVLVASPFFPRVPTRMLLFYSAAGAVLGSLLPSMWLDRRVQARQRDLRVG